MNTIQRFIARMCHIPLGADQVRVTTRESAKLRLEEWRKSEHLVQQSVVLARQPAWLAQMDVLRNEHPCHLVFNTIGAHPNDRLAHQSKVEGYELCLNNLEAFSKNFKKNEQLIETFEQIKGDDNERAKSRR